MENNRRRPRLPTPPKSDVKLAIEATEQAKEILHKALKILAKSEDVHKRAELIHEQVAEMLIKLANPVLTVSGDVEEDLKRALETFKKSPHKFVNVQSSTRFIGVDFDKETTEKLEQKKCMDVMNTIMNLAVMNQNLFDITVALDSHSNCFDMRVVKNGDYEKFDYKNVPLLMSRYVYLGRSDIDNNSPLEQLLKIEDELIDLIADIKDQQESDGNEVAA